MDAETRRHGDTEFSENHGRLTRRQGDAGTRGHRENADRATERLGESARSKASNATLVKAVRAINAELRRSGPLVGRTSRRVSQSGLRKNRIRGFNRGPLRQRLEGGATCGPLRYRFLHFL